jgi:hypothetical protein
LYQRLEDYKYLFGDLSQISDERCHESLCNHRCPSSFLDGLETKTLPQANREGERALALKSTSVARMDGISESRSGSLSDRQIIGDRDYRIGDRLRSESTPDLGNRGKVCAFEEQLIRIPELLRRNRCLPSLLNGDEKKTLLQAKGDRTRALAGLSITRMDSISKNKTRSFGCRQTVPGLGYDGTMYDSAEQLKGMAGRRTSVDSGATIMESSRSHTDCNRVGSFEFHQNPSPTLASCTNINAVAAPEEKIIVRKKNRPLHRCLSTNSMVTGIIKPSRYSKGDAQMNKSMHSYLVNPSRRSTIDGHMSSSIQSDLIKSSQNCQGDFQSHSFMYDSIMHSHRPISSSPSNSVNLDRWIPKGVEFSPSSEVLVFEISNESRSPRETSLPNGCYPVSW